jgi:hypothetical protein
MVDCERIYLAESAASTAGSFFTTKSHLFRGDFTFENLSILIPTQYHKQKHLSSV